MARSVLKSICIISCNSPDLYIFVQLMPLAKSMPDERSCHLRGFSQLRIISSLEVSGNRGRIQVEPPGGLFERRPIEKLLDGLPLFCRDLEHQRVVQAVDQIDGAVEGFVAGCKSGQHLEFEKAVGLDVFDGPARELKGLAAEPVDGRLNAVGNVADADSDPERQRPEHRAQVQNNGGDGRQVSGNGLKFVPGRDGIGQVDEFPLQMPFGYGSELFPQQGAHALPGARFQDVGNQYGVDSRSHRAILLQEYLFVRKCTSICLCTKTYKSTNL